MEDLLDAENVLIVHWHVRKPMMAAGPFVNDWQRPLECCNRKLIIIRNSCRTAHAEVVERQPQRVTAAQCVSS